MRELTVSIGGMGAIGWPVARALDGGIAGLRLVAVSANNRAGAEAKVATLKTPVPVGSLADMAEADVVVECAPAAVFDEVAWPAIEAGRIFLPLSCGAMLSRMELIDRAAETGAQIVVPTGALLGLDAVRGAAQGPVTSITLSTRKPPGGLAGAPHVEKNKIDLAAIHEPTCVFQGSAREAAAGFPANINVGAALSLAGIGADRTTVEIWADPTVDRNTHTVTVEAEAARFTMTIENVPSPENPRTGRLTPLSVLATLRGLVEPMRVGT
ncbi:MAG: aspartate dehydrogenase [Alphaproteobacteria bacterium]